MANRLLIVMSLFISGRCCAQWPWYGQEWYEHDMSLSWIANHEEEETMVSLEKEYHVSLRVQYEYYPDSQTKNKIAEYRFDRRGNLTETMLINPGDSTVYFEHHTYVYNFNDQIIQRNDTDMGNISSMKYEYDANGRRTKEMLYSRSAILESVSDYTYDKNNRLISKINRSNGKMSSANYYKYNADGRLISDELDTPKGISAIQTFIYDTAGNLTRQNFYTGPKKDSLVSYNIFTYDNAGHMSAFEMHDANDRWRRTTRFTYNSSGRVSIRSEKSEYTEFVENMSYDSRGLFISEKRSRAESQLRYEFYPVDTATPVVLKNVFFESGKSELLPASFPQLDSLAKSLKQHPEWNIEITGHTDNVGEEARNIRLSELRAKAVADYLLRAGIEQGRLQFVGCGSSRPIDSNETEQGRARNRRVEFVLH